MQPAGTQSCDNWMSSERPKANAFARPNKTAGTPLNSRPFSLVPLAQLPEVGVRPFQRTPNSASSGEWWAYRWAFDHYCPKSARPNSSTTVAIWRRECVVFDARLQHVPTRCEQIRAITKQGEQHPLRGLDASEIIRCPSKRDSTNTCVFDEGETTLNVNSANSLTKKTSALRLCCSTDR